MRQKKRTQERARWRGGRGRGMAPELAVQTGRAPAAHLEGQALQQRGRPCVCRPLAGRTWRGLRVGGLSEPCLPPCNATSCARGPADLTPSATPGLPRATRSTRLKPRAHTRWAGHTFLMPPQDGRTPIAHTLLDQFHSFIPQTSSAAQVLSVPFTSVLPAPGTGVGTWLVPRDLAHQAVRQQLEDRRMDGQMDEWVGV